MTDLAEDRGPDHGTPEFLAKHKTRQVETEDAGIFAMLVEEECLLDRLKATGMLDGSKPEDKERRFGAGIWLRRLFDRAGLRRKTGMSFEPPVQGQGGTSDAQFWNWQCWNESLREMGYFAALLVKVCVFDELPSGYTLRNLVFALDKLADYRGL